ncbi:MAG TPA: aminotransferase class I/II-fold pyridoxal phosphate-dependent enzyme [Candidatus Blautia faecipullorum]|nr:aminotransferase class I/II-fold pyridoxal phosphate-dependent enzyme [Candidatus Blautia faecipullorum]
MRFSKRLDRFGDEIFAALNNRRMELERQGMTIYNMSVGTPDFQTPEHIKQALAEAAMDDENWKYSLRDLPELLDAVCEYYQKRFRVEISPDMVMSVYGSQEGMGHLGMTLCDEGDTVLLPDPCYPVFAAGSLMAGAVPYYYPLTAEHDFLPYVKDIPEDVARKAKYMIVSLPSNPVGSVAVPGLYEEIVEFGKKYDILIIHDNAYSDIIYDGEYGGSFLATPGAKEIGVEFFSLSKSFNVTGARISFLVGRPDVIAALRKLRSQIDFGMFLPIQKAGITALKGSLDSVKEQCALYQERRDALCEGLRSIGWDLPNGKGTMFVWARIPGGRMDSMDFCMELMEKAGVIVTPGASFGPHGEGYVRFALVLPPEKIREAVAAIQRSDL